MLKILTYTLITSVIITSNSYAQMTHSSIFPEMKSLNPAVISSRPAATFSISMNNDKSIKDQDLSSKYGSGSYSKEEGVLTSNNIFYGGKGGGVTIEALTNISTGALEFGFDLANQVQGASSFEGTADTQFIGIGVGFGNFFGVSIAQSVMKVDSSFIATIDSGDGSGPQTFTTNSETTTTTTRVRAGVRGNYGADFGLYYEANSEENDSSTTASTSGGNPSGTETTSTSTVGVGLGYKASKVHLEAFYEKRLEDIELQSGETYSPVRYGASIETRLGSITIGYTGLYYVDGFSDLEKKMYDQLIFSTSLYEARLENIINFSFGGEKGHSFGGSFSQTTIKADEPSKVDSDKFPTETVVQGISAKYRYSF